MKGLNYFIYLLAFKPLFFNSCKKGCTDPNAENYNPEAKKITVLATLLIYPPI